VVLVYAATVVDGTLDWRREALEGRFFEAAEIPWNDLAFRSTSDALRDHLAR
jgi:hypothetical protein